MNCESIHCCLGYMCLIVFSVSKNKTQRDLNSEEAPIGMSQQLEHGVKHQVEKMNVQNFTKTKNKTKRNNTKLECHHIKCL